MSTLYHPGAAAATVFRAGEGDSRPERGGGAGRRPSARGKPAVPPCAAAPLCGPRAGLPGENRRGACFSAGRLLHYIYIIFLCE